MWRVQCGSSGRYNGAPTFRNGCSSADEGCQGVCTLPGPPECAWIQMPSRKKDFLKFFICAYARALGFAERAIAVPGIRWIAKKRRYWTAPKRIQKWTEKRSQGRISSAPKAFQNWLKKWSQNHDFQGRNFFLKLRARHCSAPGQCFRAIFQKHGIFGNLFYLAQNCSKWHPEPVPKPLQKLLQNRSRNCSQGAFKLHARRAFWGLFELFHQGACISANKKFPKILLKFLGRAFVKRKMCKSVRSLPVNRLCACRIARTFFQKFPPT